MGYGSAYAAFAFLWIDEHDEARRIGGAGIWVDANEGDADKAIRDARRSLEQDPDHLHKITRLAILLYWAGRVDEARPLLERALDEGPEGRPIATHLDHYVTLLLAMARRLAGDEVGAQAAAEIVRRDHAARSAAGRNHPDHDLSGATIAAFDLDTEGTIAALRSAVQRGLRDKSVLDDPFFDDVRDDPDFAALEAEWDAILAEERENVLQLICFNNPVPDDWRPLPETCEGVVDRG